MANEKTIGLSGVCLQQQPHQKLHSFKQETLTQLARGKVSIESMMTCQIVVLAVLDIVLLSRPSLPTAKGTLQCKMRRASNSTQLRILAY